MNCMSHRDMWPTSLSLVFQNLPTPSIEGQAVGHFYSRCGHNNEKVKTKKQ